MVTLGLVLCGVAALEGMKLLAFNQDFYNPFLALEIALRFALMVSANVAVGAMLVFVGAGSMVAVSLVLVLQSRKGVRRARAGTLSLARHRRAGGGALERVTRVPWHSTCPSGGMSILLFILFGLVVGFIARALLPGRQRLGVIATILLGIAGSFTGGFLAAMFTDSHVTDLNTAGIIGSVLGAMLLLIVAGGLFGARD